MMTFSNIAYRQALGSTNQNHFSSGFKGNNKDVNSPGVNKLGFGSSDDYVNWSPLAKEILYTSQWSNVTDFRDPHYGEKTAIVEALRNNDPMVPNPRQDSIGAIVSAVMIEGERISVPVTVSHPKGKAARIFADARDFHKLERAKTEYLANQKQNI